MLSARQRILVLAMASVGALAWWLRQGGETPSPNTDGSERRPDYTVDNFDVTRIDESGAPHRHLTATELRHYPDDDTKELEIPRLTLYVETGPPWLVRSETAWISSDDNLIRMHGEVHIDRAAGVGTQPVHMKTRELVVKRDENYAHTDQPVRITSETDWVTAENGAQVWLEEKLQIKLLGRVRGELVISRADEETPPRSNNQSNDHPRQPQ
ncbi:LPS export ABC transporter periplasmic protein LptC [Candidatus Thiosymbion oneisti]|uniref:LPS export ABC transporter periplasmic protein LptC n=1 Tax=Candidatus Thiosymbion oneisti TaxID=589554 RepID=UPI00105CA810|nr:LPS export ABC transporter periplasmic protein LptC [Candidatus Thiosymbion oneisti]